jgi:hypothetical protein
VAELHLDVGVQPGDEVLLGKKVQIRCVAFKAIEKKFESDENVILNTPANNKIENPRR